ncbi:MAG: hypothetical protein U0575_04115 [Phycisphaerales bacterium]
MRLVRRSWFSWDFAIEGPRGMPWGEVGLAFWGERGSITVPGERCRVSRQGLAGPFLLEGRSGELARAVKVSLFRQEFIVTAEGRDYTLRRLSWWRREFGLFSGDGQVGSVAPDSWFTQGGQADLPEEMPGWLRGFVIWLTLWMWKRDANAAGS